MRGLAGARGTQTMLALVVAGCATVGAVSGCSATRNTDNAQASALASNSSAASAALSASSAGGPASATVAATPAAPVIDDYREAARGLDYKLAYTLIRKLPAAELSRPNTKLAHGRLALLSGHHAEAAALLSGLQQQLPLLKDEIARWQIDAAAVAGPHAPAAQKLAASPRVADLLVAAETYMRAKNLNAARTTVDKAIKRAERNRRGNDAARGHALRARIAEQTKKVGVAAADYRWLLKNTSSSTLIRDGIAGVDRVKGPLSVPERVHALARSTTRDNLQATQTQLSALQVKYPQHLHATNKAIADAHYRARDYDSALKALDLVAGSPSPHATEAKYYAARCAARLGKTDIALERYALIARQHNNSDWGVRSRYRRAELLLSSGRYADAARAFSHYLSRNKRGADRDAARYGYALSLLSSGEALRARKAFTTLRKKSKERRFRALLQHLEGVAAMRAKDLPRARKLWRALIAEQPLTWPSMAAHARLLALGDKPPPQMEPAAATGYLPLQAQLPPAVAILNALGLDEDAERHLIGIEQATAEHYPKRESEALCQLYGQLSGARRRQRVGNRAVALEVLMRPAGAAERWAWQCVYPQPFGEVVRRAEQRYSLPSGLVYAVMRQESAFATSARSPVGARGLMQLMPNTAKRAAAEAGVDYRIDAITQPGINVTLGAFYLGKLMKNFHGSVPLAVAGYNAGPQAAARWLAGARDADADLWVARIPYRETRNYVMRVVANFARYQYLFGGIESVTPWSLTLPAPASIGDDAY